MEQLLKDIIYCLCKKLIEIYFLFHASARFFLIFHHPSPAPPPTHPLGYLLVVPSDRQIFYWRQNVYAYLRVIDRGPPVYQKLIQWE